MRTLPYERARIDMTGLPYSMPRWNADFDTPLLPWTMNHAWGHVALGDSPVEERIARAAPALAFVAPAPPAAPGAGS